MIVYWFRSPSFTYVPSCEQSPMFPTSRWNFPGSDSTTCPRHATMPSDVFRE